MAGGEGRELSQVIEDLGCAAQTSGGRVSVEEILEVVGKRSFGPFLLLTGLCGMSPISALPGAPTLLSVMSFLVAVQLAAGRKTIWLPKFVLRLSASQEKVSRAAELAQRPAAVIDKIVRQRLTSLTSSPADRLVGACCCALALAVPPLELLPFATFIPMAAIAVFGLSLVARDGVLVLGGLLLTCALVALVAFQLLG